MADFNIPQLRNRRLSSLLADPSVMDNYQPTQPLSGLLDYSDPAVKAGPDAIGPPTIAGGLLSLDPTDYIGPQTLGKLAAGLKGLLAGGALPMAGIIKDVGKMPKKGIYPPSITADMVIPGGGNGLFGPNMSGNINKLTTGDYLGRYMPMWGAEGKPFYAIGDDAKELKSFMESRIAKSEAGTTSAKTAKLNSSTLGKLQKEFGDVFDVAKSTQSKSEYITHRPTGTKIRISDHDLPLHYDQPDIDLRSMMTPEEQVAIIRKFLDQ